MDESVRDALRAIPSVNDIVTDTRIASLTQFLVPSVVVSIARFHQERYRNALLAGTRCHGDDVIDAVSADLKLLTGTRSNLVVNGTGVVIHTNLGRSPVSADTARAMALHAERYQALEVDLESGDRGGRGEDVQTLMRVLTGAESTLVVNNNAAAVLLILAATSAGREVVVSRGEAVEIGGGFRVPDVLSTSGAHLVEVGTTNRTYVSDYERAIGPNTAALLKVHASNFAVVGFTSSATVRELAPLARRTDVLLLEDVGSGCLLSTSDYGLQHEPTLAESIAAGADVVCASGDKLLGGPQAGLILGRSDVVEKIAKHPLARALRADKTCLAGIASTLRHYVRGEASERIPVWWSLSRDAAWLEQRVRRWACDIGSERLSVVQTESVIGGGSLPGRTQPSWALAIEARSRGADELARRLRTGTPGIMPRIVDGRVAIDARTVLQDEDHMVLEAVRAVLN